MNLPKNKSMHNESMQQYLHALRRRHDWLNDRRALFTTLRYLPENLERELVRVVSAHNGDPLDDDTSAPASYTRGICEVRASP